MKRHCRTLLTLLTLLIIAVALPLSGCSGGKRISDIVAHFAAEGVAAAPLDDDARLKYERESGNILHLTTAHHTLPGEVIVAIKRIQEQESFLIASIPVTFIRCKTEEEAAYLQRTLKAFEESGDRMAGIFSEMDPGSDIELIATFTTSAQNGKFVAVIQRAKVTKEGRIRTKLRKGDAVVGRIKELFLTFTAQ